MTENELTKLKKAMRNLDEKVQQAVFYFNLNDTNITDEKLNEMHLKLKEAEKHLKTAMEILKKYDNSDDGLDVGKALKLF